MVERGKRGREEVGDVGEQRMENYFIFFFFCLNFFDHVTILSSGRVQCEKNNNKRKKRPRVRNIIHTYKTLWCVYIIDIFYKTTFYMMFVTYSHSIHSHVTQSKRQGLNIYTFYSMTNNQPIKRDIVWLNIIIRHNKKKNQKNTSILRCLYWYSIENKTKLKSNTALSINANNSRIHRLLI